MRLRDACYLDWLRVNLNIFFHAMWSARTLVLVKASTMSSNTNILTQLKVFAKAAAMGKAAMQSLFLKYYVNFLYFNIIICFKDYSVYIVEIPPL